MEYDGANMWYVYMLLANVTLALGLLKPARGTPYSKALCHPKCFALYAVISHIFEEWVSGDGFSAGTDRPRIGKGF